MTAPWIILPGYLGYEFHPASGRCRHINGCDVPTLRGCYPLWRDGRREMMSPQQLRALTADNTLGAEPTAKAVARSARHVKALKNAVLSMADDLRDVADDFEGFRACAALRSAILDHRIVALQRGLRRMSNKRAALLNEITRLQGRVGELARAALASERATACPDCEALRRENHDLRNSAQGYHSRGIEHSLKAVEDMATERDALRTVVAELRAELAVYRVGDSL